PERVVRAATVEHDAFASGAAAFRRERAPAPLPSECEPGSRVACVPGGGPYMRCIRFPDDVHRLRRSACNTPLVVAFEHEPVEFTCAPAASPIGISERTEWVSARTPWVALDRDGTGCVESAGELFAGFEA